MRASGEGRRQLGHACEQRRDRLLLARGDVLDRGAPRTQTRSGACRAAQPSDVCFIAVKDPRDDDCIPIAAGDDLCVKVVVTRTEQGVADLDERLRALELDTFFDAPLPDLRQEFGAGIVVLDSPDASPPPGTVGIFRSEQANAAVALLRDGTRRYIRQDGEVFSTNVPFLGRTGSLDSLF